MAFMVLTDTGHVAISKSIKDQQLYLAWGDLPEYLDSPSSVTATELTDTINTGFPLGSYSYVITALNDAGETTPSDEVTVNVTGSLSTVKLSWGAVAGATGYNIYGRSNDNDKKFITSVKETEWTDKYEIISSDKLPPSTNTTSADPWTTNPVNPLVTYKGLYRELGRRKVISTKYVKPDPNGPYNTNQGRWSESDIPTRSIYAYVSYDLNDAANNTIYQYGIYIGTVPKEGLENKQYLLPVEILEKGSLLSIENISPIFRNSSTRETYEIVMTF